MHAATLQSGQRNEYFAHFLPQKWQFASPFFLGQPTCGWKHSTGNLPLALFGGGFLASLEVGLLISADFRCRDSACSLNVVQFLRIVSCRSSTRICTRRSFASLSCCSLAFLAASFDRSSAFLSLSFRKRSFASRSSSAFFSLSFRKRSLASRCCCSRALLPASLDRSSASLSFCALNLSRSALCAASRSSSANLRALSASAFLLATSSAAFRRILSSSAFLSSSLACWASLISRY